MNHEQEQGWMWGREVRRPLQLLGLFTVGRFVRARPSRLFSRLHQIEFSPPLVETSPRNPQFLRQLADVLAVPHALYRHLLKLTGVSLLFHFAAPFPAKGAHPDCLNSRVQSISLCRQPARKDPLCRLDSQTLAHGSVELVEIIGGGMSGEPKKLLEGMARFRPPLTLPMRAKTANVGTKRYAGKEASENKQASGACRKGRCFAS